MARQRRRSRGRVVDIDPVTWWTNQDEADTIIASEQLWAWLSASPSAILHQYNTLLTDLRRHTLRGSHACAQRTLELLRNLIGGCKIQTVKLLIQSLCVMGRELLAAAPAELAIMNIVRRVLSLVREEAELVVKREVEGDGERRGGGERDGAGLDGGDVARYGRTRGLSASGSASAPEEEDVLAINFKRVRSDVLEAINDLMDELANVNASVSDSVGGYIHSNDIILTHGADDTVQSFLLAAAGYVMDSEGGSLRRKRKKDCRTFEVFVTEAAPSLDGHKMALELAKHDIKATVIADAAVFAVMARVHKVIVGAHVVMADGGLISKAGAHAVALAAKHHSVPFVCVTGLFKLCPIYAGGGVRATGDGSFGFKNILLSPGDVYDFATADLKVLHPHSVVDVQNPAFDFVPPRLVTLFVTNDRDAQPSYVYRLLAENYHRADSI